MTFTTYSLLNVASAVLIGGLGVVIASVRITARTQNRHYRTARTYLSVAFILLALLKLVEFAVPKDNENSLTGCIALIVGALQAMCFTASLLLFIRPQWVTPRRVWSQLAVILLASVALVLCQVLLPVAHYRVALIVASLLMSHCWRSTRWCSARPIVSLATTCTTTIRRKTSTASCGG